MKRWLPLALVLVVGGGALYLGQRRKVDAPASAQAILNFIAGSQRELTRLPMGATRISDAEEIRVGQQLLRSYSQRYSGNGGREQADIQAYISHVGSTVAARTHRKLPYSFHYVPDPNFINAFALPGGPVFIGQGLINLMDSEDELASVLGHEVEHIDHYHCAERVQVEARTRRLGAVGELMNLPIEVFEAGYSKDQELESDREGTRLAVLAGYSPTGALRLFETFDRLYEEHVRRARTPQEEITSVALQTLSGYFRSHPPSAERAQQIRSLMAGERWPVHAERDLGIAYILTTQRAANAYEQHRFAQTRKLAEMALRAQPDYLPALRLRAQAEEFEGDFAAAAKSWREVLDRQPIPEFMGAVEYAHSLAAAGDVAKGAEEYSSWLAASKFAGDGGLRACAAGLQLLAGREAPASELARQLRLNQVPDRDPDSLGALGWWYYRAGRYPQAVDLLSAAVEMRPGTPALHADLGWALLEQQKLESAMDQFQRARQTYGIIVYSAGGPEPPPEGSMGWAVALWQAQRQDEAVREFERIAKAEPEWTNARWVRGMFPARVAAVLATMQQQANRLKRLPQRAATYP
ncbi:MAG TPA: M48 family metalloprotease [Terriglobales bacterium]|nr:M48 family metalloprotease [Terriglobales bacterium]